MYVMLLVVLYVFCVLPNADCAGEQGGQNENNKTDDPGSAGRQSSSAGTSSIGTPARPSAPTGDPVRLSLSRGERPHASTQGVEKVHQQSPSDEPDDSQFPYDDIVFGWLRAPQEATGRAGDSQKESPPPGGTSADDQKFPYDDLVYKMLIQPLPQEAPEGAEGAQGGSRSYEDASTGATGGDEGSLDLLVPLRGLPEENTQGAERASGATSDVGWSSEVASASFGWRPPGASLEEVLDAITSLREALSNADTLWLLHCKAADLDTEEKLRAAEAALEAALIRLRTMIESRGMDMSQNPNSLDKRAEDSLERIMQIWKEDP